MSSLSRISRLDSAYWFAIAAEIAVLWLAGSFIVGAARQLPNLAEIITNAMYLQLFLGSREILYVAWSLCFEVQFYLVLVGCLCPCQGDKAVVTPCTRQLCSAQGPSRPDTGATR